MLYYFPPCAGDVLGIGSLLLVLGANYGDEGRYCMVWLRNYPLSPGGLAFRRARRPMLVKSQLMTAMRERQAILELMDLCPLNPGGVMGYVQQKL